MKINSGIFLKYAYVKRVSFRKAVLWKDKQISLNPRIVSQIKSKGIKKIIFEDTDKNEQWSISATTFFNNAQLRQVGQEKQWYIGIGLFDKSAIVKQ